MTARGIADRLIQRHGVDFAIGYVEGRRRWYWDRYHDGAASILAIAWRVAMLAAITDAIARRRNHA